MKEFVIIVPFAALAVPAAAKPVDMTCSMRSRTDTSAPLEQYQISVDKEAGTFSYAVGGNPPKVLQASFTGNEVTAKDSNKRPAITVLNDWQINLSTRRAKLETAIRSTKFLAIDPPSVSEGSCTVTRAPSP